MKVTLYLWMVMIPGELHEIYAEDQAEAEQKAMAWVKMRQQEGWLSLMRYPDGFQIHRSRLPGHMEIEKQGR